MTETSTTNARSDDATPADAAGPSRTPPRSLTSHPSQTPGGWRGIPANRLVGLGVFAVMGLLLVTHNWWILTHQRIEDGDFAANSILIDRAKHFTLLVGNYSRVGFNHPGPALLFVQGLAEVVLRDWIPLTRGAFNAHVLGVITLNAALVGTAASILARRTGRPLAGVAMLLAAVVITHWQPGALTSTWMPDVYIWPFLLFIVAAPSVVSGEPRDLPIAAFAGGLLVHGHASFVMYVAVFSMAIVVCLALQLWRHQIRISRLSLWLTAGVLALFALPIVVNLVLHWPGELVKYRDYSNSSYTGKHSLADVWHFVMQYWGGGIIAVIGLVGAAVLSSLVRVRGARAYLLSLTASVVLGTILTFVYAVRGVDDLRYEYVARFSLALPALTAVVWVVSLLLILRPGRIAEIVIGVAALVALLALAGHTMTDPYPGAPWVPEALIAVQSSGPPGQPVVLRFDGNGWPPATGLIEQARRMGVPMCVENSVWAFMFTKAVICDDAERATGRVVQIVGPAPPTAGAFFVIPGFQLVVPSG